MGEMLKYYCSWESTLVPLKANKDKLRCFLMPTDLSSQTSPFAPEQSFFLTSVLTL